MLVEARVPVLNLSLGIAADLVDAVHAYGGTVSARSRTVATPGRPPSGAPTRWSSPGTRRQGTAATCRPSCSSRWCARPSTSPDRRGRVRRRPGVGRRAGARRRRRLHGHPLRVSAESPVHGEIVRLLLARDPVGHRRHRPDRRPAGPAPRPGAGRRTGVTRRGGARVVGHGGDTFASVRLGDTARGVVAIGQVVGRVHDVRTCREIIEGTVTTAEALLGGVEAHRSTS